MRHPYVVKSVCLSANYNSCRVTPPLNWENIGFCTKNDLFSIGIDRLAVNEPGAGSKYSKTARLYSAYYNRTRRYDIRASGWGGQSKKISMQRVTISANARDLIWIVAVESWIYGEDLCTIYTFAQLLPLNYISNSTKVSMVPNLMELNKWRTNFAFRHNF